MTDSRERSIVEVLQYRSEKVVPMVPTTVRLPILLENELREFCADYQIHLSVLVRELIARGWRDVKAESGFEPSSHT